MESELFLEIIESPEGTHRLGIAYPGPGKTTLESREVSLEEGGAVEEVILDGHTIRVYCRYRKEHEEK